MRTATLKTYNEVINSGELSPQREAVYANMWKHKRATASEIAKSLRVRVKGSVCARLTELRDRGIVKERGYVKCPISGLVVAQWATLNQTPHKPKKRLSPAQRRANELEKALEASEFLRTRQLTLLRKLRKKNRDLRITMKNKK